MSEHEALPNVASGEFFLNLYPRPTPNPVSAPTPNNIATTTGLLVYHPDGDCFGGRSVISQLRRTKRELGIKHRLARS